MFYEEKVIDGILHWRNHPKGRWIPFTPIALTARLLEAGKPTPEPEAKPEDYADVRRRFNSWRLRAKRRLLNDFASRLEGVRGSGFHYALERDFGKAVIDLTYPWIDLTHPWDAQDDQSDAFADSLVLRELVRSVCERIATQEKQFTTLREAVDTMKASLNTPAVQERREKEAVLTDEDAMEAARYSRQESVVHKAIGEASQLAEKNLEESREAARKVAEAGLGQWTTAVRESRRRLAENQTPENGPDQPEPLMTPEQFCYWLRGALEVTGSRELGPAAIDTINRHLDLVMQPVSRTGRRSDTAPTRFC